MKKKIRLKDLSKEQLQKKKDSLKIFTGVFVVLITALSFLGILNYLSGGEIYWSSMVLTICTIGGFLPVYQELRQVQEELRIRS